MYLGKNGLDGRKCERYIKGDRVEGMGYLE